MWVFQKHVSGDTEQLIKYHVLKIRNDFSIRVFRKTNVLYALLENFSGVLHINHHSLRACEDTTD